MLLVDSTGLSLLDKSNVNFQSYKNMNDLNNDQKLKLFANPKLFQDNFVLDGYMANDLIEMLTSMIKIRKAEQTLAEHRRLGDIGGPVHLGVGQEAIAVGCSASLMATDRVFGAHRSHAHLLALGAPGALLQTASVRAANIVSVSLKRVQKTGTRCCIYQLASLKH